MSACVSVCQDSNPETRGSISWRGTYFLSLQVDSCADLFVSDTPLPPPPPLHLHGTHQNVCAHVKGPISICRQRVDFTVSGNTKTLHIWRTKARLRCTVAARLPRGKQPDFPMQCIGTINWSNLIQFNLKKFVLKSDLTNQKRSCWKIYSIFSKWPLCYHLTLRSHNFTLTLNTVL